MWLPRTFRHVMTPPDLVIFDCDGVLVDSEGISVAVLTEIVARAGGSLSEAQAYERFLGRSMASVVAILERDFAFRFTDAHHAETQDTLYRRFRAELKPVPGVAEALRALPCPACVASSSPPERIRLSLEIAGLLPLLDPHIFSASMVKNGKPAPDLFLHAARAMGAAPGACAVVEDSAVGVEAAKAAGMRVLAFAGASHAGAPALRAALEAHRPDAIFERMEDLPILLGFTLRLGTARAS